MNIIIITHFFPPLNAVASLRLYAFAQYMAEYGHNVHVVTTKKNQKDGQLDLQFKKQALYRVHELDYIPRYLRRTWSGNGPRPQAMSDGSVKPRRSGTLRSMLGTIRSEYFGSFLEFRDLWVRKATRFSCELAKEIRCDVIISSFSPTSPQYVGYLVKKKYPGITWVADYRDLWSTSPFEKAKFPVGRVQNMIEKKIMKTADLVTTVSEPLKNDLEPLFNKPTYVIENGFFPDDEYKSVESGNIFGNRHVISYTGSIHGKRRDPVPFFAALREMIENGEVNSERFEVHFYGSNSYTIRDEVDRMGLGQVVKLMNQVPYEQAIRIQRDSQALLFLEMNEPYAKGVLTGKIFEYIVAGRPIICVGPTLEHETGRLINETNTGFVCGYDKDLIKAAIRKTFEARPVVPDWQKIESYRRDRTTLKLLAIIEKIRNRH